MQVKALLEAALNPRHDPTLDRSDALREALDRAEPLLTHLSTPPSSSGSRTPVHTTASHPAMSHLRPAQPNGGITPAGADGILSADDSSSNLVKALSSMEDHMAKQQQQQQLATTPRADSASSIFAMEGRRRSSEGLADVEDGSGDNDEEEDPDLSAVKGLAEEARRRLEAQARDQVPTTI